jgi:hypothetical protein
MSRQHPVHDTIAALTRVQKTRIIVNPDAPTHLQVSYSPEPAPCLLQQLVEELACSTSGGGGRTIPSSRLLMATDAWDLWTQIQTSTHAWARELELDRRPYLHRVHGGRRPDRPTRQRQPAPWFATLAVAAGTPPEVLTQLGDRLGAVATTLPPAPARQQLADPGRLHQLPPAGRLLRHVAATATSRGLDPLADAIHRSGQRWRAQIEQMLHGVQEQRGVRGATCPACEARWVLEDRADGATYRLPTIILVQRQVAGEPLTWLACLACGWSRGAGDLLQATAATWLAMLADIHQRLHQLLPPRRVAA